MRRLPQSEQIAAVLAVLFWLAAGCATANDSQSPALRSEVVVAADGSGDFKTVQAAINAAPATRSARRFVIRIKPGTYKEKLHVPAAKGPITFRGENAATTILTFDDHAGTPGADGKPMGTSRSASILIQAPDFHAENITFENSAGPVGQAVAVNVWSDRGVFRRCRFIGWQDTLLVNRNRQYFEDCYIDGHVDFIFGASSAWFERCHIHCRRNGYVTAASTPQEKPFGYVFSNCRITGEPGVQTYLGRPWRPYGSVTFLNTEMGAVIRPEGWDNWRNPENEKTARYAEWRSRGPGANPGARVAWSRQLTDAEAAALTVEKALGGWNPGKTPLAPERAAAAVPEAGNAPLATERVAALPPERRAAWQRYLERSAARLRAEQAALAAEMKANNLAAPIPAPEGPLYRVQSGTPAEWYASDEARHIADAVVSFQTPSGGWSKAVASDKGPRRPGMHWTTRTEGWYYVGTFDNRATTEQMQLLARVHTAAPRADLRAAFLKGLDYIFDAQFPNGGWPQTYPLAGEYHDNVTYNDDLMVHVLELLRDVAEGEPPFAFVDPARRAWARQAVDAGVGCILRSQIVQNGRRTVWCAQHDPLTLAPAPARRFEPASLSGGESVGITRFLIGIDRPSAAVKEAIQSAVAWFEASKLTGIEVVKKPDPATARGFDTVVVPNPTAAPVWARFYELNTNRPIFIGREGPIRYDVTEIDYERRTGYAWYVTSPRDLLEKRYPAWRAKWGASSALPAALAAASPSRAADAAALPALYIIGDSTAANHTRTPTIQGWGAPFLTYFDPAKINVVNAALGGRSSRTFITEGHLDKLVARLKPGDTVLVQFGHNDPYPLNDANGRGSLFGLGEETQEIVRLTTGKPEVLHTFGWYMRKMLRDIRAKGAHPIVLTLTIRSRWINGKIERDASQSPPPTAERPTDPSPYSVWSAQIARAMQVPLLDVHNLIADRYDKEGPDIVNTYFNSPRDPTHRNPRGAQVDAEIVLACLKALKGPSFDVYLSDEGKAVPPADARYIFPNTPAAASAPAAVDLQPFEFKGNLN